MRDQLVECLDKILTSWSGNDEPEIFIDLVAEDYLMSLVRQAHIPLRYLDTLRDDVRAEIMDILRVRSYGYPSLGDYLQTQKVSPRRPTT